MGKTVHRSELNTKQFSLYVAQYSISYVHFLITSHAGVTCFTWQIVSLIRTWNVTYLFEWVFIKVRDVNRNWIKPLMRNHVCLRHGVAIVHHPSQPCLHHYRPLIFSSDLELNIAVSLWACAELLNDWSLVVGLFLWKLHFSYSHSVHGSGFCAGLFLIFKYTTWNDTLHILWGGWLN